jgi:hypothetical protein
MNQKDSAATPMYGAFTSTPDDTPYTAVENQTSLTAGLSTMPSCGPNVPGPLLAGPSTSTAAIKAAQHNRAAVAKADALGKPAIPAAMRTIARQPGDQAPGGGLLLSAGNHPNNPANDLIWRQLARLAPPTSVASDATNEVQVALRRGAAVSAAPLLSWKLSARNRSYYWDLVGVRGVLS